MVGIVAMAGYLEYIGNNVSSVVRSITENDGYKAQAQKVFDFTQRNYNVLFFGAFCYHLAYSSLDFALSGYLGFWSEKNVRIKSSVDQALKPSDKKKVKPNDNKATLVPISSFFKGSEPKTYLLLCILAVRILLDIQMSALVTGFFAGVAVRKLFFTPPKSISASP